MAGFLSGAFFFFFSMIGFIFFVIYLLAFFRDGEILINIKKKKSKKGKGLREAQFGIIKIMF